MTRVFIRKSAYDEIIAMRKAYNPNEPRGEGGRWVSSGGGAVKHSGEYVLTKGGSKDFGEIPPDVARIIGRQPGKIRLRIGENMGAESDSRGYGEKHIERASRLRQLQNAGYENARDFVEDVSGGYDSIYKGQGSSLVLCKHDASKNLVEFVQLTPSSDGDFYDVKSTLIARSDYLKNKTPLFKKSGGNIGTGKGAVQSTLGKSPSAVTGSSNVKEVRAGVAPAIPSLQKGCLPITDSRNPHFSYNSTIPQGAEKSSVSERVAEILSGVFPPDAQKSLTWSGYKLQGRTAFGGLEISIENRKGSVRRGVDSDGHKWAVKMNYDYGYIRGTEGVDGDHLDCYLGGDEGARFVYIVRQNNPATGEYDEDKCMLGFGSLAEAKAAYLSQYDRPGFLGGIDVMEFGDFKGYVLAKEHHGKRVAAKGLGFGEIAKSLLSGFDGAAAARRRRARVRAAWAHKTGDSARKCAGKAGAFAFRRYKPTAGGFKQTAGARGLRRIGRAGGGAGSRKSTKRKGAEACAKPANFRLGRKAQFWRLHYGKDYRRQDRGARAGDG